MLTWIVLAAALSASVLGFVAPGADTGRVANAVAPRPNVVMIVTDDQRWDTLWAMPNVRSLLSDHGVTFPQAFVVNPICCPSRSSLFTGKYSHNTGVYGNASVGRAFGGLAAYRSHGNEASNLAVWLDGAGYETALIGKYLNGYSPSTLRIPPGWDRFVASTTDQYYGFETNVDGTLVTYGSAPADYSATVETGFIDGFIRGTDAATPLFLYYAPKAPHSPAVPAPGDENAFSGLAPWRPPSYNEADVSDKPAYIAGRAKLGAAKRAKLDAFRIDQYRTLLAVDRTVASIVDALADTGRLSTTMIVFTSDNGYAWGEHRWSDKHVPYEESIRVPLVIRYDPFARAGVTSGEMALNIDIAPTIAALAGVAAPGADGVDLGPILANTPGATGRSRFLIEHLASAGAPTYCALRMARWKLVEYGSGELELYDLLNDPNELTNVSGDAAQASRVASMRATLHAECDPPPPGVTWP
jgi:N-acetylglucosamine-6-sulfatase